MSIYYRKEQYREKLFIKSLHLKNARKELFQILPINFTYEEFLEVFKTYYSCEWDDIVAYCRGKSKDAERRKQRNLRTTNFCSPEIFLHKSINMNRGSIRTLSAELRYKLIEKLEKKNEQKKKCRENKLRENMVIVQKVCPSYVRTLINNYFNQRRSDNLDINSRYLIILEAGIFKCNETIDFLYKINDCEKNDDLRLEAFKALQRLGEHPWLARNRKGRKKISQIKSIDIKTNPTELLRLILNNQHLLYQRYDIFLSHSSIDHELLLEVKRKLNKKGKVVYIDWVNDNVMLAREYQNNDTWSALQVRMDQSLKMVYILTPHSVESEWTSREVEYFKNNGKEVMVYEPAKAKTSWPEYLKNCDEITI